MDKPSPVPLPLGFVVEGLEDPLLGRLVDADARVGNLEAHHARRRPFRAMIQGDLHLERAPLRHRIPRIDRHVHDDFL